MADFVVHDALGKVLRWGSCAEDSVALQARDGEIAVEVPSLDAFDCGESPRLVLGYIIDPQTKAVTAELMLAAEYQRQADRQQAISLLTSTDWYVIRAAETNVPIPPEINTARAAARATISAARGDAE
jgi:hypothetical protein